MGATFAVLAAPWVVYLNVCVHIAMKWCACGKSKLPAPKLITC
jgi:hypothetical protein